MQWLSNTIRMLFSWWTGPLALYWGSARLNRWMRKMRKDQDPTIYSERERYKYFATKMKGVTKRLGVKVNVLGWDNLPKGGAWMVGNHTSNYDGAYLVSGFKNKVKIMGVAKDNLRSNRYVSGYFIANDGVFLNRHSLRQSLEQLENGTKIAKEKGKTIMIFPEGKRSFDTELLDFKNASFKFPQKYFLPIVPVTILGTLEAKRFFRFKTRTVTIIVHKPIKAIDHSKMPTELISNRVRDKILADIKNWEANLSPKELNYHNKLKEKAKQNQKKYEEKQAKKEAKAKAKIANDYSETNNNDLKTTDTNSEVK